MNASVNSTTSTAGGDLFALVGNFNDCYLAAWLITSKSR